ncbi:MAG: hypothetical protein OQK11_02250, partial [Thiovulaceae bacterium]|nr:hypothetical protein [Sulfurimonadaceae bacterium]
LLNLKQIKDYLKISLFYKPKEGIIAFLNYFIFIYSSIKQVVKLIYIFPQRFLFSGDVYTQDVTIFE